MANRENKPAANNLASLSYKDAGVDIEKADALVDNFRAYGEQTKHPGVLSGIGGFGAMFSLFAERRYTDPVLVSGTDGVGTKLLIAEHVGRYDGIGIDLVAMCVNDIICVGARPLFFLDYYATAALDSARCTDVVKSIADGCKLAQCALVGGETAELPGVYPPGGFDLAGFAVGVAERSALVDGTRAEPGDVIFGLPSSGVHSNGFSLARRIVTERLGGYDAPCPVDGAEGQTWGERLLAPTRIYVPAVLALLAANVDIRAMAHITGGGLPGNLLRPYPDRLGADIDADVDGAAWPRPALFTALATAGAVSDEEMRKTFNLGIGYCITVAAADAAAVEAVSATGDLDGALHGLRRLGTVTDSGEVRFVRGCA